MKKIEVKWEFWLSGGKILKGKWAITGGFRTEKTYQVSIM